MLKLLDILKESLYLPNPEEKKYMQSIQKNEKYSKLITRGLEKNPVVNEVEVIEFPPDGKYYKNPTYKIIVFVDAQKIKKTKDGFSDFQRIHKEISFILIKVLGNSLELRDKIKIELE